MVWYVHVTCGCGIWVCDVSVVLVWHVGVACGCGMSVWCDMSVLCGMLVWHVGAVCGMWVLF